MNIDWVGIIKELINSITNQKVRSLLIVLAIVAAVSVSSDNFDNVYFYIIIVVTVSYIIFEDPINRYIKSFADKRFITNPPNITRNNHLSTLELLSQMSLDDKEAISKILDKTGRECSKALNYPGYEIRVNIFGLNWDGNLQIHPSILYNARLYKDCELELIINKGSGNVGKCFESGRIEVCTIENDWGDKRLNEEQMQVIHNSLKWIISLPVKRKGEKPIYIVNLDGLGELENVENLEKAGKLIYKYVQMIYYLVAKDIEKEE